MVVVPGLLQTTVVTVLKNDRSVVCKGQGQVCVWGGEHIKLVALHAHSMHLLSARHIVIGKQCLRLAPSTWRQWKSGGQGPVAWR